MDILRISRNVTIIALILSLLFHGSTIFYIFMQKKNNPLLPSKEQMEHTQEIQKQEKDNAWVETKARAGNFGAPILFQDDPDDESIAQPTEEKSLAKEENLEVAAKNLESEINNSTQEQLPDHQLDQNIETDVEIKEYPEPQKNAIEFKSPQQTQPPLPVKKNPPTIKKRKPHPTNAQANPFAAIPARTPKPPITLAQLTQGFLEQRKEDAGIHGISMIGKKHGLPTDEQMKYERYLQKLSWCLQNSFTINQSRMPFLSIDNSVYLFFALDRDGILKQAVITKSSGNKLWDNFILFIFRDASSSFPPVPGYIKDNPFQITCVIPLKIIIQ